MLYYFDLTLHKAMNLAYSDKSSGNGRATTIGLAKALTVLSASINHKNMNESNCLVLSDYYLVPAFPVFQFFYTVSNIAIADFCTVIEQESMSKPVFWHLMFKVFSLVAI